MSRNHPRFYDGPHDARVYDLDAYRLELHSTDCRCRACRSTVPVASDALDATMMGKLACAGALVGTAIAFAIDAHGAWAALLSTVSW